MEQVNNTQTAGITDIVFDGPPSPPAPRFVEVERSDGSGVRLGEWVQRDDGYWAIRLPATIEQINAAAEMLELCEVLERYLDGICNHGAFGRDVDFRRWEKVRIVIAKAKG